MRGTIPLQRSYCSPLRGGIKDLKYPARHARLDHPDVRDERYTTLADLPQTNEAVDAPTLRKLLMLFLYLQGRPVLEIAGAMKCSRVTVFRAVRSFDPGAFQDESADA